MIPNRQFPKGTLQLVEITEDAKILLEELPTSTKNRDKMNNIRNQLLMINPKRNIVVSENNALLRN